MKKRLLKNLHLSEKLFLCYTLPLLLVVSGYLAITAIRQQRESNQLLGDYHRDMSVRVVASLEEEVRQMDALLGAVYQDTDALIALLNGPTVTGYSTGSRSLQHRMQDLLYLTPRMENFAFIRGDNTLAVLCSNDGAYQRGSSEHIWQPILDGEANLVCIGPIPDLNIMTPCLTVMRAVRDPRNGKVAGVSMVYQYFSGVEPLLLQARRSTDEIVQLTDVDGTLLFSSAADEQALQVRPAGTVNGLEKVKIDTSPYLHFAASSRKYIWKLDVYVPYTPVTPLKAIFGGTNILAIPLLILLSLLLGMLFSHSVTRPLTKLTRKMAAVSDGNFVKMEVSAAEAEAGDEVGIISRTYNQMLDNIQTLIHEKYELEAVKLQAELDALQSQINPHFLFNTLNSIKSVSMLADDETCSEMVQALADILRVTLQQGSSLITLERELQYLKKYIYLQSFRFGSKFSIQYELDPETLPCQVPFLTLQPLVENVFKHGLAVASCCGAPCCRICIRSTLQDGRLLLQVTNTGTPIPPEKLAELNAALQEEKPSLSAHIGLMNIRRRMYLHYGASSRIWLTVSEQETAVWLDLPLQSREET